MRTTSTSALEFLRRCRCAWRLRMQYGYSWHAAWFFSE